jgi:hypothetical protein
MNNPLATANATRGGDCRVPRSRRQILENNPRAVLRVIRART